MAIRISWFVKGWERKSIWSDLIEGRSMEDRHFWTTGSVG